MKKKLITAILTGCMLASAAITSFAGSWEKDQIGWWYKNDDGGYPANGWHWIDGDNNGTAECYFFNETGYCLIDTMTPDGYIVDANGAWVIDGIVQAQKVTITPPAAATSTTTTVTTEITATQETNWHGSFPYISGMVQEIPSSGSFWTVNINTGKYHATSKVANLLPANTRYYPGDAATLESKGYSRCKKRGCY